MVKKLGTAGSQHMIETKTVGCTILLCHLLDPAASCVHESSSPQFHQVATLSLAVSGIGSGHMLDSRVSFASVNVQHSRCIIYH